MVWTESTKRRGESCENQIGALEVRPVPAGNGAIQTKIEYTSFLTGDASCGRAAWQSRAPPPDTRTPAETVKYVDTAKTSQSSGDVKLTHSAC